VIDVLFEVFGVTFEEAEDLCTYAEILCMVQDILIIDLSFDDRRVLL